jgi:competence protein ComEC
VLNSAHQPALWLFLAIASGIVFDRYLATGASPYLAVASLSCVAWFLSRRFSLPWLTGLLLLVATTVVGGLWHHVWWRLYPANEISCWAEEDGGAVALIGETQTESRFLAPQKDLPMSFQDATEKTIVEIKAQQLRVGQEWVPCSGNLVVLIKARVELRAGQQVRFLGTLKPTGSTRNPGEFDFRQHYRRARILAWLYCDSEESFEVLEESRFGLNPLRSIFRERLNRVIWENLDEQRAGLASAILLGNREQMPIEARDQFMLTGTVHVLAISGLHVGILAAVVMGLLRLISAPRRIRLWTVMAFVIFYAWLVEFQAPVTRSMILIVLLCVSRIFGRPAFSLNLLALAGIVVLILNPTDLFGIGPQLSFLAVFTMSVCLSAQQPVEPVERLVRGSRGVPWQTLQHGWDWIKNAFVVSAVITIVTTPLVAYYFHLVVPIGLLINPLVLLPMGTALFGGLTVMIFGEWFSLGAFVGGLVCDVSLWLIQTFVDRGSRIESGHWWTSGPGLASILIFYAVFLTPGILLRGFWTPTRLTVLLVAWTGVCWMGPQAISSLLIQRNNELAEQTTLTVVDVGHGNCVLVELPNGQKLLIDAGSFGSEIGGVRRISAALWSRKISHIDALFISHSDVDHFNAIPGLCSRFSIGSIFVSPNVLEAEDASVQHLKNALAGTGVELQPITRGLEIELGGEARIRVLGPSAFREPGSDNSASLVLELIASGRRVLFPADIESPGLDFLLKTQIDPVDIAFAPHHGSLGSQPLEFTKWCRASMIVISGQKSRVPKSVYDTYSQFGSQVGSTSHGGALSVRMTPARIAWENWLEVRERGQKRFSGKYEHVLEGTFQKESAKKADPKVSTSRRQ